MSSVDGSGLIGLPGSASNDPRMRATPLSHERWQAGRNKGAKVAVEIILIGLVAALAEAQDGLDIRTTIFHGMELSYEVVDGLAIHDGDIILGTAQEAAARAPDGLPALRSPDSLHVDDRVRRLAPFPREVLWPNAIVPYVIDDDVPHPEWILEAMSIWNTSTVVEFVERTTERDYLRFALREEPGCVAVFGRGFDGGEQIMPILPGGCTVPITLHELGHAIGMAHEQERRDRDRYVRMLWQNIRPGTNRLNPKEWGAAIGPYDYRSVMHYGFSSDDLRRHGQILMMDTIPPGMPMGQTVELSPGDIDSVARLYGHIPAAHVVSTNPAGLEIIVDGARMIAPARFDWEPGSEHTLEVPSPQYRGAARFLFGRWSDDGNRAHTITATQDTTLHQASFVAQHQVATAASPAHAGTVTIHPPADTDGYHTLRTPVELLATPAPDSSYRFLNWQVETDYWWSWVLRRSYGEASNPARTFVKAGMAARALFIEGPIFRIQSNIEAVPVIVRGGEHMAPVAFPAARLGGTTTVTAEPIEDWRRSYRQRFRSWSDGGDISHSIMVPRREDSTLTLTLDTEYRLSTSAWYNHEIVATPPLPEGGFYPEGAEVRLLAVERPPEEFIGWSGDVSGADPAALVVMDAGRHVEAVFAAGTTEIPVGQQIPVSLNWTAGESDYDRRYVRPPVDASELTIEFHTHARTNRAEAGLFVTHQRDPWPWDVRHNDADRILGDGSTTVTVLRPSRGWPAAYFILIRAAESDDAGTGTLDGTLVATVSRDAVANRPPRAVGTIADRNLTLGVGALVLDVSKAFSDPDGDAVTYAAVSSSPAVAAAAVSAETVSVTPVGTGSSTITVTATDDGGLSAVQRFAVTVAFRATFTDHPIVPATTPIRAIHFTELRDRIDALRRRGGLPAFRWTDRTLVAGVTPVRRIHLMELRSALDAVYDAAGRSRPAYADARAEAGATPIRAAHIMELRAAVLRVE